MMEGARILTHPFGVHIVFVWQHPPPVCAEHWKVFLGHCGGLSLETWQSDGEVALQQKIPERVSCVGP